MIDFCSLFGATKVKSVISPPEIYVGIAVEAFVLTGSVGALGSSCEMILLTIEVFPAENSPTKAMLVLF